MGATCISCEKFYENIKDGFYLKKNGNRDSPRCKSCRNQSKKFQNSYKTQGEDLNEKQRIRYHNLKKLNSDFNITHNERIDFYRKRKLLTPEGKENSLRWSREARSRRRALKVNAVGQHTEAEWQELCRKYNYLCLACLKNKFLTRDHIVPLSKGGTDFIDNIQPLCMSCNTSKYTKTIDYRINFVKGATKNFHLGL